MYLFGLISCSLPSNQEMGGYRGSRKTRYDAYVYFVYCDQKVLTLNLLTKNYNDSSPVSGSDSLPPPPPMAPSAATSSLATPRRAVCVSAFVLVVVEVVGGCDDEVEGAVELCVDMTME